MPHVCPICSIIYPKEEMLAPKQRCPECGAVAQYYCAIAVQSDKIVCFAPGGEIVMTYDRVSKN